MPKQQQSEHAPPLPVLQVAHSCNPAQRSAAQEETRSSCCRTHGGDDSSGTRRKDLRFVNETKHCVGAVVAIEPEGVCSSLALDSGATETFTPPDILTPFQGGAEYEVANCVQISSMGESEFVAPE